MRTSGPFLFFYNAFQKILVLAIFVSIFSSGNLKSVQAQNDVISEVSGNVLADGQFVYGPNVKDFVVQDYIEANAPRCFMDVPNILVLIPRCT